MIYPLNQVTSGIDKIYDVPLEFLTNAQLSKTCSDTLVPKWFKPVYNRCPGVKAKFETLYKAFKRLNKAKQSELISIYTASKNIQKICSDLTNIYKGVDKYDKTLRKPLKNLFEFLFNETVGTAVFRTNANMHIDDHYTLFQEKNNVHVCPFCGLESYPNPEFRRAEYDHYLPISIYPWLGVNFNNLVPMGDHCNGKKNATNLLYSDYTIDKRRLVWYPYEWINHSVTLKCKKKPTLADMRGEWEIIFKAKSAMNQDKINTWIEVFEITSRFNNHIQRFHIRFIDDFAQKNKLKGQRLTETQLIAELKDYRANGIGDRRLETMAQLKSIWADYYIKTKDKSQLALLVHSIANQTARIKP
jgi:hypothetical protein